MAEILGKIFSFVFGNHSMIATVIISMFPIIELKGAIPIGMSVDYFGEYALDGTSAFLLSLLGSSLVVPIIALIFTPIVRWLKGTKVFKRVGEFIDQKVTRHKTDIDNKVNKSKSNTKSTIVKCLLIFAFVAIPLPLTGVWTGTCVAVAVGLNLWQTCLSVILGNVVAGLIIVFVCSVFPEIITILSIIFMVIVLVLVAIILFKIFLPKKDANSIESAKEDSD